MVSTNHVPFQIQNFHFFAKSQYLCLVLLKTVHYIYILLKKYILFVSCNGLKKIRVGRSVKLSFFALFICRKMCVLCIFYVDWELGGQRKF